MISESRETGFSIETTIVAPVTGGTEAILVEQDEDSRDALAAHLRQRGFTVRTASDGFTALVDIADRMPALTVIRHGLGGREEFERIIGLAVMLYPQSRIILTTPAAERVGDSPYPVLTLPLNGGDFDHLLEESGFLRQTRSA